MSENVELAPVIGGGNLFRGDDDAKEQGLLAVLQVIIWEC